jgi:membrane fusion protein (multidrug efflux system)
MQPGRRQAFRVRSLVKGFIVLTIVVLGLSVLVSRWQFGSSHEETEDAYVTGHPHQVSARISNVVEAVLVDDNDHVDKGQLLVKLDPQEFKLEVARARAKLDIALSEAQSSKTEIAYSDKTASAESTQAAGGIDASYAGIEHQRSSLADATEQVSVARSELAEAQSRLTRAELDCKRYTVLEERGVVSSQQKEHAISDYEVCRSAEEAKEEAVQQALTRCDVLRSSLREANARLKESYGKEEKAKSLKVFTHVKEDRYKVAQAAVSQARSELDEAKLKLAYCNVYAPTSGRIGKRTVEVGHRIEPGQQLLDIVEDYVWVVANFKETQVRRMKVGQLATVRIDSLPDTVLTGIIDSFSPGSGASFALLPPDNATGNFTKIVQRVPVKIRLERAAIKTIKDCMPVGLSALVQVDMNRMATSEDLSQLRAMDAPEKKVWDGDGKGI